MVFGTRSPVCVRETSEKSFRSAKLNSELEPQIHTILTPEISKDISVFGNTTNESSPTVTKPRRRVAVCTVPKPGLLLVKPEKQPNSDNPTLREERSSDFSADQNTPRRRITVCCHPDFAGGDRYSESCQSNDKVQTRRNVSSNSEHESSGSSVKRRITVCCQPNNSMFDFIRQESLEDQPSVHTPILSPNEIQPEMLDSQCTKTTNSPYRKAPVYTQPEFGYATIIKYESRQEQIRNRADILQQSNFIPRIEVTHENNGDSTESENNQGRVTTATRRVGIQLHSVASNITRRLSTQWQSSLLSQFRRFSCDLQTYLIKEPS